MIAQVIPVGKLSETPHGVRSLLRVIAYSRDVGRVREREIERMVHWARQVLGWKELRPYEESIARLAMGSVDASTAVLGELERVAVETCHSAWYVDRLIDVFGRSLALQILKRDLHALPTYAREHPQIGQ